MSYANMFELNKCLKDSLQYCSDHPDRDHCETFEPMLVRALENLTKATDSSDRKFTSWRMEDRDGRLAWKHLARDLAQVQRELKKVNAVGYLDQKVMYWDTGTLVLAVDEMIDYLRERTEDLDFAEEKADKLERQKDSALNDTHDSDEALKDYIRFAQMRSDAMTETVNTIASFRRVLRRELGKKSDDYHSIRWPQAVASDEAVL